MIFFTMLHNGYAKGGSDLVNKIEELDFVTRAEILSPNGRIKDSIGYNKNLESYVAYVSNGKTNYKISIVVKGIKADPKLEKKIKNHLGI